MAETGSAKIDLVVGGDSDDLADGRGGKEGHLGEVRRGKREKGRRGRTIRYCRRASDCWRWM